MEKLSQINIGPLRGFGDLGLENDVGNIEWGQTLLTFSGVFTVVVGLASVIASIWFLFKIISGGIAIMSAGGDAGKVTEARTSITNGLIGLLVVLLSTVIVGFIGTILGIDLLNVASLIVQTGN